MKRGSMIEKGRGGMQTSNFETANKKFVKKFADKSHISCLITQNKSFSLQRLMRDYNEIKNSNFSLFGVSAAPLDTDFFIWHGNIKALTDNIYKGCVIHLEIIFSNTYPIDPPKIKVLNYSTLKHPNILVDGSLCLDMLEVSKDKYKGWTSGYTVLSILLQLQNFFFDIEDEYLTLEEKKEISTNLKIINEYVCPSCAHKGSSNPWPEFTKTENQVKTLSFEKYKEEKKKEYVCYHRKTSFEETPLGLGITIAKIPRSGEIKGIIPRLDYISLKSFTKQKVRKDMIGQNFTHWFPLYFGVKEEQFLHLCKKTISLIATGSTKNFSPALIFNIIPKFFLSLVTDITSENVANSSRSLKILMHIYRIMLYLIEKYPEVLKEFEDRVTKFIEDPLSRHKDITNSLGDLLIYVTLSQKHKIDQLLPCYMEEQMDRQIFWILQAIPELEDLIESSTIDDVRGKVCFKSFIVGAHILLFFFYFNRKIIHKPTKSAKDISMYLDSNYGNINDEEIDVHQKEIQKILKIDNFNDYYKFLEIKPLSDKEVNEKLKQAYNNSLNKRYHGFDAVRYVPDEKAQFKKMFEKFPSLSELLGEDKNLIDENSEFWEKLVLEKFDIVQLIQYTYPSKKLTPEFILKKYEIIRRENLITKYGHNYNDYKKTLIDDFSDYDFKIENEADSLLSKFSWRKTYLKIFLELYLRHFNYIADFKYLYDFLDNCHGEIIHLDIDIYDSDKLKSEYNYLRVVISKLLKLEYLNLNLFNSFKYEGKLLKNLVKGFNNFKTSNGSLLYLKIYNENSGESTEKNKHQSIWNLLDKLPDIKVLDLSYSILNQLAATKIRNHFYYFKSISTLILNNCGINNNILKDIADGMMKAKGIENVYLSKNSFNSVSTLVNNLAFQSNLRILDISDNKCTDIQDLKNSIVKLFKMSQSIQVFIMNKIPSLAKNFDQDFYSSLGDNSSLEYLDISECTELSSFKHLGHAIAFNSLKKGGLNTLKLEGLHIDYKKFVELIEGLSISEEIHNKWYGNNHNTEIMKDTREYLSFASNNLITLININDLKQKNINHVKDLLENSPNLEGLDFSSSTTNKYFVEMLVQAFQGPNNIGYLKMKSFLTGELVKQFCNCFFMKDQSINNYIKLQKINLANNNFGYSGIESLANILKKNKTIKSVNLYKNLFDVNGARRLAESLLENTSLEILDIGYNRIKDLGFTKIIESILANKNSKLKKLSVRCNFIKGETAFKNISLLLENETKLEDLQLTNNLIDEKTINAIYKQLQLSHNKNSLNLDLFNICYYNSPERLDRCVWISSFSGYISKRDIDIAIKEAENKIIINDGSYLGFPIDIKIFRGRTLPNNKQKKIGDHQAFVEFIDPNSVNRLLKLASTSGFILTAKKMKVYKAGSKPGLLLPKKRLTK
jgi:ubiquitin-protein ligase/Ran GTPase-activating protein (RanGAP) involved in mRNA processing and transport